MCMSRAITFAAVAALFIGCGPGDRADMADALSASSADPGNAGGNKLVKVLTRNLYIGADITPFVRGEPGESLTDIWANIQATNCPKRQPRSPTGSRASPTSSGSRRRTASR
jgi:hypothetical protein